MDDEMDKVSQTTNKHEKAMKAIDDACVEKANAENLKPSSLGIDKVRREIKKAHENRLAFFARRG